jgi:hypothetical protein
LADCIGFNGKVSLVLIFSIDVHARIGSKMHQKLFVEDRVPRTIKLYSSDNELMFFPEKYGQPIILVPSLQNEFKYIVYPKKNDPIDLVLNCVDISTRELVKSWLVRVTPEKPEINHVHKVDVKVNLASTIKYEYTNALNNYVVYNFESNSPEILKVVDSRLPFNASEKKQLTINIPPQRQIGRAEVLVFVSDLEELYSETILFQLNYY